MFKYKTLALVWFVAFYVSACVTYIHPLSADPFQAMPTKEREPKKPTGFLAFTAEFDFQGAMSAPTIQLDLKNIDTEETLYLQLEGGEASTHTRQLPIVYNLPVGHYELVRSLVIVPGGSIGRKDYSGLQAVVQLEKSLRPVTLETNQFLHMGIIKFIFTQTEQGNRINYNVRWTLNFAKPDLNVWQPYQTLINKTSSVYQVHLTTGEWVQHPFTK